MDLTFQVAVNETDLTPDLLTLLLTEALDRLAAEIGGPFATVPTRIIVERNLP